MTDTAIVDTTFLGHDLKCPLCDERLVVKASVCVDDVTVRVAGKDGFTPILAASAGVNVVSGGIDHRCTLKARSDL